MGCGKVPLEKRKEVFTVTTWSHGPQMRDWPLTPAFLNVQTLFFDPNRNGNFNNNGRFICDVSLTSF